jgi:kynurenine formamidase
MRRVELSHIVADGTVTYPGLPAPVICDFWTREEAAAHYADGATFHIARLEMVANTGTYIDAPFHRYAEGVDLADLDLATCTALPALCVTIPEEVRAIGAAAFTDLEVAGHAVLIRTGWDRHFGTEAYAHDHPYLTADAADRLVAHGAVLVGIDSVNIDRIEGETRPVHTALLGAGIPIVEHLTGLDALPLRGFRFTAAPARFRGVGSFPVRAYALLDEPPDAPSMES